MTLEETIERFKEQAATLRMARDYGCDECAAEYEQLAEWLRELKQRREAEVSAKPKTNADRIRQMTDDEELLSAIGTGCYRCAYSNGECDSGYGEGCIDGNLAWLKQECEENDET